MEKKGDLILSPGSLHAEREALLTLAIRRFSPVAVKIVVSEETNFKTIQAAIYVRCAAHLAR